MNELKVFTNERLGKIRTIEHNGEPYFIGKDLAEVLGYTNTRDALSKHVHDDDKATVAYHDGRQNRMKTPWDFTYSELRAISRYCRVDFIQLVDGEIKLR